MKNALVTIIAMALLMVWGSSAAFAGEDREVIDDEGEGVALYAAEVSLRDAVRIAEETIGGRALSGEFEEEDGLWAYSIEVLQSDNADIEVVIDAATGEVLKTERED